MRNTANQQQAYGLAIYLALLLTATAFGQAAVRQVDGSVLMKVPVLVENTKSLRGQPLSASDVRVFEDKQERKVLALDESRDQGFAWIVLMDASNSERPYFDHLADFTADELKNLVRGGDDIVAAGTFQVKLQHSSLADAKQAAVYLHNAKAEGGTALYDSVLEACEYFGPLAATSGKQAVLIVISDGDDNQSRHTADEAIAAALRANIAIVTYSLNGNSSTLPGRASRVLEAMSRATGAPYFHPQGFESLAKAFSETREQMQRRYVLTYVTATNPGQFHRIEVKPVEKKLKLSAPAGRFDPVADVTQ